MGARAAAICLLLFALMPGLAQTAPSASTGARTLPRQTGVPASGGAAEQRKNDPAKEVDIRNLLELTGAKALAKQTMDGMLDSIKPLLADSFPPGDYRVKLIDLFAAKFHAKADPQYLVELAIPIYDRHFSHDEIKGLLQFYRTPLGQKTIRELPAVSVEMQQAGRKWGEGLGQDSIQEVLAEHPDLAQALEAAAKSSQH